MNYNINRKDELKKVSKNSETSNSSSKSFFIPHSDSIRLETRLKDRFKVLLIRIGRSQNWLADEVGISKGSMSKIANGDWFPCSQTMKRIAKILEVDSVVIFGDSKYWKEWHDKMVYDDGGKNEKM